ncbi:hypothetical protein U1Q18_017361, partial [Sarracenia purpurea var. burkii]
IFDQKPFSVKLRDRRKNGGGRRSLRRKRRERGSSAPPSLAIDAIGDDGRGAREGERET